MQSSNFFPMGQHVAASAEISSSHFFSPQVFMSSSPMHFSTSIPFFSQSLLAYSHPRSISFEFISSAIFAQDDVDVMHPTVPALSAQIFFIASSPSPTVAILGHVHTHSNDSKSVSSSLSSGSESWHAFVVA